MKTIEFRGKTIEYDEKCTKSYRWQKLAARGDMGAIERLFNGRDEEIGDLFDDDADAMAELVTAITQEMKEAKN
jgi:hypothetical protein